jgi:uncharacterized RDD family membrane protein YckC
MVTELPRRVPTVSVVLRPRWGVPEAIAIGPPALPDSRTGPVTLVGMAASTPTPGAADLAPTETAGFGRRLGALVIDWALCTLVASLLVDDLRANPWPQLGVFVLVNLFFVGLFGQTPGMWLTRIRCISVIDGGAIGLPRAIVRAILLALVIPAVVSDGDGRGLHDRAAKSIMVRRA